MGTASRKAINVLYLAAEAEPFARVGGLGDVAGALPPALRAVPIDVDSHYGIDIRLAIPFYNSIRAADYPIEQVAEFDVSSRNGPVHATVYETRLANLPVYLVDGEPIRVVDTVYGKDFEADAEKFIFFSLACVQLAQEIGWQVDIIHANDWHTAAAIHLLKRIRKRDRFFANTKGVISIHNLPFMGTGAGKALKLYQLPPSRNPDMPAWGRSLPLPMGIDAADWILTVSPHYAEEMLTPGFGCDLQDYLKTKADHFSGILNGLDTDLWNPAADKCIKQRFTSESLPERQVNKADLQRELDLPQDEAIPLLAYVGRMENQKGLDLALDALPKLKSQSWQCVILGTGNKVIEADARQMQDAHPENVRVLIKFDIPLSHRVYAGADMLMMPSRYEPCGLAQMIAMRYGCIPVASATGGLVNTIINHTANARGTGFLFDLAVHNGLVKALDKALEVFKKKAAWLAIQKNAMAQDHSWKNSAIEYAAVYNKLLQN